MLLPPAEAEGRAHARHGRAWCRRRRVGPGYRWGIDASPVAVE
ncbi:hypothetical protein DVS28_b0450 (plasmid) [Euzebya pacifica]|uniref:Uncharacterized protein n=1 Tax=Euzebya pacifica TaxID=1608957 RepID=A0A346Y6U3_9ACTN|nr:hypothetical protein DVS28_b0450 [Euzebya pacifica]